MPSVSRVRAGHPTIGDYAAYVPVDGAVAKLHRWQDAGAQIDYLSSHRNPDDVALDAFVLREHGFPMGRAVAARLARVMATWPGARRPTSSSKTTARALGADQITYPQIPPDVRARIKSIVVPEFGGLDHLPNRPQALLTFEP